MPYVRTYDRLKSAKWDNADEEDPTVRFYFLGLRTVREGGQRGENLFRLLSELKVIRDLPSVKSVAVCTDHALNMISKNVGLATSVVEASHGAIEGVFAFGCSVFYVGFLFHVLQLFVFIHLLHFPCLPPLPPPPYFFQFTASLTARILLAETL
jgi:hypothetical protein